MTAYLPALLLALFAAWCGTFEGAAAPSGAVSGLLALLSVTAWAAVDPRDPLRLGRVGGWLPALLLVAVLLSWVASPVPRAGRTAVLLLPAYLLLPGAVSRAWRTARRRRRGLAAVAAVVGAIALYALLEWALATGAPRPAMPLGHHNLLAGWLVLTLPLAWAAASAPGAGRRQRWLGRGAALLAAVAVVASRSLIGTVALAVEVAVLAVGKRRWRPWLIVAGIVALALQLPRLAALITGADPSAAARQVYLEAGLRGWMAQPLTGWGPGSTPWTIAAFIEPLPGVTPPSEVLGQLHSLPLALVYELGLTGLMAATALAAWFVHRRLGERRQAVDGRLLAAGLTALAGGAVAAIGDAWLAVPALPLALAVAAGACLAGGRPEAAEEVSPEEVSDSPGEVSPPEEVSDTSGRPRGGAPGLRRRLLAAVYPLLALLLLARPEAARWLAESADRAASPGERRALLERAVALDPAFPLYRLQLAATLTGAETGPAEAGAMPAEIADLAHQAALGTPGLALPWLVAGQLELAAGDPRAGLTLANAQNLAPLAALPPFLRMTGDPSALGAADCGARALLADPRLAAATFWQEYPSLFDAAFDRLETWPGIDAGWRREMVRRTCVGAGEIVKQDVSYRGTSTTDPSHGGRFASENALHAFRRRGELPPVRLPLAADCLAAFDLPPATILATSDPAAFPRATCAPSRTR